MHPKRTMRPTRIPRVCEKCQAPFAVEPAVLRRGGNAGKFCSSDCRYAASTGKWAPFADRFWAKVNKTDCCWLWTGSTYKGSQPYGTIGTGGKHGKVVKAHRASWLIHFGPIPDGLHVLHNCPDGDNPSCVNPGHLWLGTHDENMKDFWRKMRAGPLHRCCQAA